MKNELRGVSALLLCGGKGERLRPLTAEAPKPLIPIKGRPILDYLITSIQGQGIEEFIVAAGHLSGKIEKYLASNHQGLAVRFVDSGEVDILRRIRDAARHISGDFVLLYGDTLADVDLAELARSHRAHPGAATVSVWPLRSPFGVLEFGEGGAIRSFAEKPVLDKWINIGYFYFDHSILGRLDAAERFEDFLRLLIEEGQLYGYKHRGMHVTVNTHKELAEAEKSIDKFVASGRRGRGRP